MAYGLIAMPHEPTTITGGGVGTSDINDAATMQPREAVVFGGTVGTIQFGFDEAVDVTTMALIGCDASLWYLRGASTEAGLDSASAFASGTVNNPGWRGVSALHYQSTPASFEWYRVSIATTAGNVLGRVILADAFEPTYSFEIGRIRGRAPGLVFEQSAGGAIFPEQRHQRRRWSITFGDITDDEYIDYLDAIDEYTAEGNGVLFVPDTSLSDGERETESMYGLMSLASGATRQHINRYRAPMVLEELI